MFTNISIWIEFPIFTVAQTFSIPTVSVGPLSSESLPDKYLSDSQARFSFDFCRVEKPMQEIYKIWVRSLG